MHGTRNIKHNNSLLWLHTKLDLESSSTSLLNSGCVRSKIITHSGIWDRQACWSWSPPWLRWQIGDYLLETAGFKSRYGLFQIVNFFVTPAHTFFLLFCFMVLKLIAIKHTLFRKGCKSRSHRKELSWKMFTLWPPTPAEIERHNSHFIAGCGVWERLIGIEYERDRNPVYSRMGVRTIPKLWLAFNNEETKFDLAVWTRISWEFCGRLDSCKELLIALGAHQWNSDGSDKLTLNLTNH